MRRLHLQVFKPLEHVLGVLVCPLARNRSLHDSESISEEVVTEVAERLFFLCATEEELARNLVGSVGDGLCCAGHVVRIVNVVSVL